MSRRAQILKPRADLEMGQVEGGKSDPPRKQGPDIQSRSVPVDLIESNIKMEHKKQSLHHAIRLTWGERRFFPTKYTKAAIVRLSPPRGAVKTTEARVSILEELWTR